MASSASRVNWRERFKDVLHGDQAVRKETRALIKSDLASTAVALNSHRQYGLTKRGAADVLDEVVAAIPDPQEARALVEGAMSPQRLRELVAARGDLASTAAMVVSLEIFIGAMLADMDDLSQTSLSVGMMVYLWAFKAKDRDDMQEFLDYQLDAYTVEYILLAYLASTCASTADLLVKLDELDLDEARSLDLVQRHNLADVQVDPDELEEVRAEIAAHQKVQREAATLEDEVLNQDDEVADALDF